jgi:hypothetical protein
MHDDDDAAAGGAARWGERRRPDLLAEAVATADLERYAAIIASIGQADWMRFLLELVLGVGLLTPERSVLGLAKVRALAIEDHRRRRVERATPE